MKIRFLSLRRLSLMLVAVLAARSGADPVHDAMRAIDPELTPEKYDVQRADLDGDGNEDVVALANAKSGYCGSGGCTLFLLRATGESFAKVGAIRVVNPPIYLRKSTHHGWQDLLVRVGGGGAKPHFAVLAHDGTGYPPAPGGEGVDVAATDHVLFEDPIPHDGDEAHAVPPPEGRPAQLEPAALAEFDALPEMRKKVVTEALRIGRERHLDQYIFGSADPDRGGFDCSGAIYRVLGQCGLEPPRTSSTQFDWIEKSGELVKVDPGVSSLDDEVFDALKPGDLLFWSGTYKPTDGRTNHITHVQMYLGTEKKDGRPVMIGSSDGRSYRGKRQCGYGVFDFRLPRKGAKSRFAGYGPPPGMKPE